MDYDVISPFVVLFDSDLYPFLKGQKGGSPNFSDSGVLTGRSRDRETLEGSPGRSTGSGRGGTGPKSVRKWVPITTNRKGPTGGPTRPRPTFVVPGNGGDDPGDVGTRRNSYDCGEPGPEGGPRTPAYPTPVTDGTDHPPPPTRLGIPVAP